ncbi:MAG: hypothetical protein ONB05_08505 [candidate division KSB1 bacterium]|nr:hypothetical protein [candidate division KSB1 bacterium]
MTSLLDIIGGTVIGGLILLVALTATDRGTTDFFNFNSDAIVQNNLARMAYITEHDLRKMGFGIHEMQQATILQIATPQHLKFLSQLNYQTDVIADTIEYTIVPDDTIAYEDTSLVMYKVWRTVKISGQQPSTLMIGKIGNPEVFRYLDQIGNPVEIMQATKMVEVTMVAFNPRVVLSPELVCAQINAMEGKELRKKELTRLLRPSFWRQTRLVSKNLRR